MKLNDLNFLIIEDHKIIANAYKNILMAIPGINFNISIANNCDEAVNLIRRKKHHIAILDLQLPISENERFICGEDLGTLLRNEIACCKLIILTSVTDHSRILSIIQQIDPEGFLIKADIDSEDLKTAVLDVLNNKRYYSKTINSLTKKTTINGITIDDFDRQILYHLSMGEKTKDLTKFIPLSIRAIEVRKTKLKTLLSNTSEENFNLVKGAKKLGLI